MNALSRLTYWIFSQTRVGKLLDGKKTELGFLLWLLGYLLDGLTFAMAVFPNLTALAELRETLAMLQQQLSEFLKEFGMGVMVVGVGHKAIKSNEEAKGNPNSN